METGNVEISESDHWVDILARRIVSERKPPYVITSGITLSGPMHLGTLCEAFFPVAIGSKVAESGKPVKNYFISDDLDAFDSIPAVLSQYTKELTPHLGKPLAHVPDPTGKSKSFGDYFLDEMRGVMKKFEVAPEIRRMSEEYPSGRFDYYARFFLKEVDEAKRIVAESSQRDLPKDWSPIMPICQNCGRIATTAVTSFDEDSYSYTCSRDVKYTKGCGFSGKNRISDHKYKLTWRLHWPAWMDLFGTSAEGAGMDHHTKGGSWDTLVMVFNEMFKKEPPIGYKFGFFLLRGAKYSKSKGVGMGVADFMKLAPPELIKYFLLRADIDENKDFDPTGPSLMRLYEDYETASEVDASNTDRAGQKKRSAFLLAGKKRWNAKFLDVLLHYQIYRDWDKVGQILNDPDGVKHLAPYIMQWIQTGFVPDDYSFTINPTKPESMAGVLEFAGKLDDSMDALAIHNLVFDVAKESSIPPAALFGSLYTAIIGKPKGPKMGKLVKALGPTLVKDMLNKFK